jgi:hypothetical protein
MFCEWLHGEQNCFHERHHVRQMSETAPTIEYENSFEDLLEFNAFHIRTSRAGRRLRRIVAAMAAAVILAFGISFSVSAEIPWMIVLFVPFAVAAAAASQSLLERSIRKSAGRLYRDGRNVGMTGWHRLSIIDGELREESSAGSQITRLGAIEKISETPDSAYIYVSAIAAHVVPKNCVSKGDIGSFLSALRRHVGENITV